MNHGDISMVPLVNWMEQKTVIKWQKANLSSGPGIVSLLFDSFGEAQTVAEKIKKKCNFAEIGVVASVSSTGKFRVAIDGSTIVQASDLKEAQAYLSREEKPLPGIVDLVIEKQSNGTYSATWRYSPLNCVLDDKPEPAPYCKTYSDIEIKELARKQRKFINEEQRKLALPHFFREKYVTKEPLRTDRNGNGDFFVKYDSQSSFSIKNETLRRHYREDRWAKTLPNAVDLKFANAHLNENKTDLKKKDATRYGCETTDLTYSVEIKDERCWLEHHFIREGKETKIPVRPLQNEQVKAFANLGKQMYKAEEKTLN